MRFPYAGGDLDLVQVADGDGGVAQGLGVEGAGGAGVGPEHGAPVEIEDGGAGLGAVGEGRQGRRTAGFLAQSGAGDPEDPGLPDGVEVQLVGVDLEVRRLGPPVEVEREVVRREDLAEGDGRGQAGDGRHPAVVDAEAAQRLVQIGAERVVTGARDHGGVPAEAGGGDRHVRRRPAEELAEGRHLGERNTGLQRVEVHSDPPHGDQVVGHRLPFVMAPPGFLVPHAERCQCFVRTFGPVPCRHTVTNTPVVSHMSRPCRPQVTRRLQAFTNGHSASFQGAQAW